MVCVVVGCIQTSGQNKGVSFLWILKTVMVNGSATEKLSKKKLSGFMSAIKLDYFTEKIFSNDRICSRLFLLGKPVSLLDETNSGRLPT